MGSTLSRNVTNSNVRPEDQCPVCYEEFNHRGGAEIMHTSFGGNSELHRVCHDCVRQLIQSLTNGSLKCPICRIPADKDLLSLSLRSAINAVHQSRRQAIEASSRNRSTLHSPANMHLLTTHEGVEVINQILSGQSPHPLPRIPPELRTPEVQAIVDTLLQDLSTLSDSAVNNRASRDQLLEMASGIRSNTHNLAATLERVAAQQSRR